MVKPNQYWIDLIIDSLAEVNVELAAEHVESLALDIQIGHENYGMYDGSECIPNPMIAETKRIEDRYKGELAEARREAAAYKSEACKLAGRDESTVWVNGEAVMTWQCRARR